MAMNNTYTRQVAANPTALNPNQRYVKQYDAGAEFMENLTKFGTEVINVYVKADYEAAKRDMRDQYDNRSIEQGNILNQANSIVDARQREAYYQKEMTKINKKYGKNIDKRFADEYARMTSLDDKKSLFDLRVRATKDLQAENRLRADREHDNMAERAASSDPAMAAEIDKRVQDDLAGMLKDGSISQYEMELKLDNYKKKKTIAGINNFLASSPADWSDEQINTTLDLLTATVADAKEKENLKGFAKAKIDGLRRQSKYLDTFNQLHSEYDLLRQSFDGNISLKDINKNMPTNASKEYKSLIKSLNGYGSSMKLDEDEKLLIKNDLYDRLAAISSNSSSTPKDYADLQNKVYSALSVGALSGAEAKKLLNDTIMPINDAWGRQIEKLSTDDIGWFSGDLGMQGVKEYLENNGWIKNHKKIAKKAKANKNLTGNLKADAVNNARVSVKAYQLYNNNLLAAAQDNGFKDINDVIALEEGNPVKRSIFRAAQNVTINQLAQDRFEFLSGVSANQQPNKVLDGGELVGNTNSVDNSALGKPVVDSRYKGTAFDAASGKYGLVRSDGTIEEVGYEKYKQFGGIR